MFYYFKICDKFVIYQKLWYFAYTRHKDCGCQSKKHQLVKRALDCEPVLVLMLAMLIKFYKLSSPHFGIDGHFLSWLSQSFFEKQMRKWMQNCFITCKILCKRMRWNNFFKSHLSLWPPFRFLCVQPHQLSKSLFPWLCIYKSGPSSPHHLGEQTPLVPGKKATRSPEARSNVNEPSMFSLLPPTGLLP